VIKGNQILTLFEASMKVELPYRFPNHADQIHEEAAEFRRLSSTDRFLAIVDMMASAEMMLATSPHRQQMLQQCQAHEEQWRRVQQELFARHGY
jgi:hypothetical protein